MLYDGILCVWQLIHPCDDASLHLERKYAKKNIIILIYLEIHDKQRTNK